MCCSKKSNLNHSIRSILDPFEFQAKEKGIQWQSALKLSEEEVWFDFDLLQKNTWESPWQRIEIHPIGRKNHFIRKP